MEDLCFRATYVEQRQVSHLKYTGTENHLAAWSSFIFRPMFILNSKTLFLTARMFRSKQKGTPARLNFLFLSSFVFSPSIKPRKPPPLLNENPFPPLPRLSYQIVSRVELEYNTDRSFDYLIPAETPFNRAASN